jgi:glyoxylase-like metal-dependent hydrolase (beta-lactamase superfamily II)
MDAGDRWRTVTPQASVLRADNPSALTLEGTNTWVLRAPGASACVVVDPGPADADEHRGRLSELGRVEAILLTHAHADHAGGVPALHELTGAPVHAVDPRFRLGGADLSGGQVLRAAGLDIAVVATPGHTADSVCFVVGDAVLTGDTILGRGTTVVAYPDGRLADYLDSLRRLARLGSRLVLPGHGPELPDLAAVAQSYLEHRAQRLQQVRAVMLARGPKVSAREVVEEVYADVNREVWPAAELSVRAQLEYLRGAAAQG